jgi:glyoxylase-like metal-dependent hydrolase (beta-lactamase superfamily II)
MPRRLADGVWWLDLGLVAPLASNAYLVDDPEDGSLTLVDTGLPLNSPRIARELRAAGEGFEASDLDRVLLTHYDLDHSGGLRRLHDAGFRGEVHLGAEDVRLVGGEWNPPLSHPKGLFHRLVRPYFDLDEVTAVVDGERVGGFTAYHTPGHNPGHTVYVHEGLEAAFLGDLVWEEGGMLTPPIWLDSYDMRAVRRSIRDFAGRVTPFEVAAMGHGDPLERGGYDALQALARRV